MTRPTSRPEAEAARIQAEADAWTRARAAHGLPPATETRAVPYDEALEARIDQIAETRDNETGEHTPLRKRTR